MNLIVCCARLTARSAWWLGSVSHWKGGGRARALRLRRARQLDHNEQRSVRDAYVAMPTRGPYKIMRSLNAILSFPLHYWCRPSSWTSSGSCPLCLTPPCLTFEPPATAARFFLCVKIEHQSIPRHGVGP